MDDTTLQRIDARVNELLAVAPLLTEVQRERLQVLLTAATTADNAVHLNPAA